MRECGQTRRETLLLYSLLATEFNNELPAVNEFCRQRVRFFDLVKFLCFVRTDM